MTGDRCEHMHVRACVGGSRRAGIPVRATVSGGELRMSLENYPHKASFFPNEQINNCAEYGVLPGSYATRSFLLHNIYKVKQEKDDAA